MIFRPLYNVENENQSQNPARSNVSNPPIFGTVLGPIWLACHAEPKDLTWESSDFIRVLISKTPMINGPGRIGRTMAEMIFLALLAQGFRSKLSLQL